MTTSDDPADALAPTGSPAGPIPISWFSYATAVTGACALVAAAINLVTHWNDDDLATGNGAVDGIDRFTSALNTISTPMLALLVVAMVADQPRTRSWAILGAAAWAFAFVLRAALDQRSFAALG